MRWICLRRAAASKKSSNTYTAAHAALGGRTLKTGQSRWFVGYKKHTLRLWLPKVGAHFEREERYQQLCRRQSEIEEKLDLTKNQAPSQVDAETPDTNEQSNAEKQTKTRSPRPKRRAAISV